MTPLIVQGADKQLTHKQIEEKLGYEIEIIKE